MQYPSSPIFKREDSTYPNYGYPMSSVGPPSSHNYGNNTAGYGSLRTDPSDVGGRRNDGTKILGCSVLVFVLAVIIAILSAAVIGLAAGTGVEANRANTAETTLAALRANMSSAPSTSSGTMGKSYDALTRGCSTNSSGVSGTIYTTQCEPVVHFPRNIPNIPWSTIAIAFP